MNLQHEFKRLLLLPIKFITTLKEQGPKESLKRIKNFTKKTLKIKPKPKTYKEYLRIREKEATLARSEFQSLDYQPLLTLIFLDIEKAENSSNISDKLSKQIYKNIESKKIDSHKDLFNILKEIKGEYFSIIHKDDEIFPDYTYELVKEINRNKRADLIFFDEEYIKVNNSTKERLPFFKPDFSIDTFTSANYFGHPLLKTESVRKLKLLESDFTQLVEWDIGLRLAEKKIPNFAYQKSFIFKY